MGDTRFDGDFLNVLSDCGRAEVFLDKVFGFLYRRTDFYKIQDSERGFKEGYPHGYASKVAYNAFCKYNKIARDEDEKKFNELRAAAEGSGAPDIANVEEVYSMDGEEVSIKREGDEVIVNVPGTSSAEDARPLSEFGQRIPPEGVDATKQSKKTKSNDAYNGAECDGYCWSQTQDDVDVKVHITKDHKKFNVEYSSGNLKATALHNGARVTLMDGKLSYPIKESELVWTVASGEYIHIALEKSSEKWWDRLLDNEEKINLGELEIEKRFDELDDEARMKILQMQQETMDKALGRPDPKKKPTKTY
ncbi:nudC domain-containing protein 3 [Galendromus occidentalis]|uniref:NudC domain-containing protein 3 n=1 Tax=Galendromus occidentalis TaxID=34638 RepID=A0AAJ7L6A6_9ACAR|nr:nudC domain-containing protein 3 [Galendromus occidentalis]